MLGIDKKSPLCLCNNNDVFKNWKEDSKFGYFGSLNSSAVLVLPGPGSPLYIGGR